MDKIQFFYPETHDLHFVENHPERPDRVVAIREALKKELLWDQFKKLPPKKNISEYVQLAHSNKMIEAIKRNSFSGGLIDSDTYLTEKTYDLAYSSAGGAISIAEAVWEKSTQYGFAMCRPPGHHATKNNSMGFCLLNNIAIAANFLLEFHQVERIAIIDIDVHHGNGTQDIFYLNPNVHFFSIHQENIYPNSGFIEEIGSKLGAGFNTNIPLPLGAGDNAREKAVTEIIIPLLDKFNPEIILVSAGFDAHWKDPLAQHLTSATGYGNTLSILAEWANINCEGKLAMFLEGGYDINAGAQSTVAIIKALLKENFHDHIGKSSIQEPENWLNNIDQIKHQWDLEFSIL